MRRRKRRSHKVLWAVCICFIAGIVLAGAGLAFRIPYAEVEVDEDSLQDKFYYQQLSGDEKIPYKEILQGVRNNTKEIYLHIKKAQRANELFQYVLDDFPELFWCDGNATSTEYAGGPGRPAYATIAPVYSYEGEEKEQKIQQVEAVAAECMANAPAGGTEYEKIKYIYEYLIRTVDYSLDAPDNQNILSALVNRVSVCAGYARGTQYLLEKMGIMCIYVTGTAAGNDGNTEDHAWNLVRCDGKYYYVDTTWGDPVFQQEDQGGVEKVMTYDYLCCSADELRKTHVVKGDFAYPACDSGDLNYYKLNGMYYDACDENTLLGVIYRAVEAGEPYTVFKFAGDELYRQADELLIGSLVGQGAQYIGSLYGLEEIPYSYEEEPVLNKITLYWFYEN